MTAKLIGALSKRTSDQCNPLLLAGTAPVFRLMRQTSLRDSVVSVREMKPPTTEFGHRRPAAQSSGLSNKTQCIKKRTHFIFLCIYFFGFFKGRNFIFHFYRRKAKYFLSVFIYGVSNS